MFKKQDKNKARRTRQKRVRKRIFGTADRPRLNVFRSLNNIYAQVIIDETGQTVVSASTLDPELRGELTNGGNVEAARKVGVLIAQRALARGINRVVFDRAGYLYHGRVAALAEAAREAGLEF